MKPIYSFLVGFRKFTIMIIFTIIITIFRAYDLLAGPDFANIFRDAVVAYFGVNVGEHLVNLGKDWLQGKLKSTSKE